MSFKVLGKPINRYDAAAKVTGEAKYAADFLERDMLVGKVLRSTIANGVVKHIDVSKAKALEGVEAVLTFKDVPDIKFPTAGHPYSLDPDHKDIEDRNMLTDRPRFYGDEIAAVVAENSVIAARALKLIEVEYEEYPVQLSTETTSAEGANQLHEGFKNNLLGEMHYEFGDVDKSFKEAAHIFEDEFETKTVQHCAMENHVSYAYQDSNKRVIVVSATQIPHIVRRIVGQAFDMPVGNIRVIKPYVGGGFGSKQDGIFEPLNVALTMAVGGRPVLLEMSREETFISSRVRHAMQFKIKTGVDQDGRITARYLSAKTAKGAYASHGFSPVAVQGATFYQLYTSESVKFDGFSYYSNAPVAGAMRAYGTPQVTFAIESHIEDIAQTLKIDPIEFRKKNLVSLGDHNELDNLDIESCGIRECIDKGREMIKWDQKKKEYQHQEGEKRKGVGMATFVYATGTHPHGMELAGARIILRPDGSIQIQVGATEIGQGSDTALSMIAAEVLTLKPEQVYLESTTDTDTTPFDTGAYASRQTYIAGTAVKKAALEVKEKILQSVEERMEEKASQLDLSEGCIVRKGTGEKVISIADFALQSYYDKGNSAPITVDIYNQVKSTAYAMGVTFADVEVDMRTGQIEVKELINVHDSGTIVNRQTAEGQVHGGMSMGLGYALTEELKFDEKTGKPLNNNLLDYKIQTMMDAPDMGVDFVETYEPTGPFGNKALGEPPTITPAPAIRNAVLDATGVSINAVPMSPQNVFDRLNEEGKLL